MAARPRLTVLPPKVSNSSTRVVPVGRAPLEAKLKLVPRLTRLSVSATSVLKLPVSSVSTKLGALAGADGPEVFTTSAVRKPTPLLVLPARSIMKAVIAVVLL